MLSSVSADVGGPPLFVDLVEADYAYVEITGGVACADTVGTAKKKTPARTGVAATVQVRVLVFNNAISCGGIFRRQRIWIVGNSSGWTRSRPAAK
ncbi:MAG: hypothetical protein V9E85_13345 [Candidatus Nanopelagicales bacterium]